MSTPTTVKYLIITAEGLDYARVEPWQGGLTAATREAKRIGGYIRKLDSDGCACEVVTDFRTESPADRGVPQDDSGRHEAELFIPDLYPCN